MSLLRSINFGGFVPGNKGFHRIPRMPDILSGRPALEAGKAESSVAMRRSMRGFIISPRHQMQPVTRLTSARQRVCIHVF